MRTCLLPGRAELVNSGGMWRHLDVPWSKLARAATWCATLLRLPAYGSPGDDVDGEGVTRLAKPVTQRGCQAGTQGGRDNQVRGRPTVGSTFVFAGRPKNVSEQELPSRKSGAKGGPWARVLDRVLTTARGP